MITYKELYLRLFASMEDAVEQLERNNAGLARDILITAQRSAEEAVMNAGDTLPDEPA